METFIKNISGGFLDLKNEWINSTIDSPMPECLLAVYDKNWFFVLSDNKSIIYIMSEFKKIYVVVKSKCNVIVINGVKIYQIQDTDDDRAIPGKKAIRPFSCTALKHPLEINMAEIIDKLIN